MAKIIRKEVRKRGIFGWIFLIAFWGFNAVMALSLYAGIKGVSEIQPQDAAQEAGTVIGATFGVGMLLAIWLLGALLLGLLVLFSRGRKTIIEETVENG